MAISINFVKTKFDLFFGGDFNEKLCYNLLIKNEIL